MAVVTLTDALADVRIETMTRAKTTLTIEAADDAGNTIVAATSLLPFAVATIITGRMISTMATH